MLDREQDGHDVSHFLTSLEPFLGVSIGLEGGNIGFNLLLVEEEAFGQGWNERLYFGEVLCPCLNGSDVITHAFASVQNLWELKSNKTDFKDSLDDVVRSACFEVGDCLLKLRYYFFGVSFSNIEASFNLSQLVVFSQTID